MQVLISESNLRILTDICSMKRHYRYLKITLVNFLQNPLLGQMGIFDPIIVHKLGCFIRLVKTESDFIVRSVESGLG